MSLRLGAKSRQGTRKSLPIEVIRAGLICSAGKMTKAASRIAWVPWSGRYMKAGPFRAVLSYPTAKCLSPPTQRAEHERAPAKSDISTRSMPKREPNLNRKLARRTKPRGSLAQHSGDPAEPNGRQHQCKSQEGQPIGDAEFIDLNSCS